ncbi:MAG: 4Fe-4S dicluster domain-containing protein [Synergistaceae bacterium]|jgi:succinate dehydrogenase/fumarate reductase-like Fe-S protein|nr:4Fe-4S dicluster domain-containing protein [Synergistaceae bacterium]
MSEKDNSSVRVFLFGKRYDVPAGLTIMAAMEYSGYRLVRGCGCRNGFCGACATIYRVHGDRELRACLACQKTVEDGMYVATLPFFPLVKEIYDMEQVRPADQVMMSLYPEIYKCVGCNACTKACSQELRVMQYIAYAQRGEYERCAEESFDCVMCGICSARCPAGISHPQVAMLARRLTGKYIRPRSQHLKDRVDALLRGAFDAEMDAMMNLPLEEIKTLYNGREIEK